MYRNTDRIALLACVVLALAACRAGGLRGTGSPLELSITTHLGDAQVFREGDPLSFFISLGSDAHVMLVYEDATGGMSQIVPNPGFETMFVRAGDFISMPPPDASFTLRVSAPFGTERAWLFASEQPLPGLQNRTADDGSLRVSGGVASVRQRLREHAVRNGARFGEASVSLTTRPN